MLKLKLGRKSKLYIENKLLIYNQILTPLWTYGAQLWGCTNEKKYKYIVQRFQNMHRKRIMVYIDK